MAMQQQQQRMYGGNMYLQQQQQQQQPWLSDSAASASYLGMPPVVGHQSQLSVQQTFSQPQGVSVSSAGNTFASPTAYHNGVQLNQQQQIMTNYYGQLKNAPYFDQQSGYGMQYANAASSSLPTQGRFPQAPYSDPSSTLPATSNAPAPNSMHPYYSQQQQFSQGYGTLHQQIGVNNAKPSIQQYSMPSVLQPQHTAVLQHSPHIKASSMFNCIFFV